jgi:hypothetical protein
MYFVKQSSNFELWRESKFSEKKKKTNVYKGQKKFFQKNSISKPISKNQIP